MTQQIVIAQCVSSLIANEINTANPKIGHLQLAMRLVRRLPFSYTANPELKSITVLLIDHNWIPLSSFRMCDALPFYLWYYDPFFLTFSQEVEAFLLRTFALFMNIACVIFMSQLAIWHNAKVLTCKTNCHTMSPNTLFSFIVFLRQCPHL